MEPVGNSVLLLLLLSAGCVLGTYKTLSLTISAPSRYDDGGTLLMQWQQPNQAEFIAVFDSIPPQTYIPDAEPLDWTLPFLSREGYKHTNIAFTQHSFPADCPTCPEGEAVIGDECTMYQIAGYLNGELLEASCLTVRPNWMEYNRSELRDVPLIALFFPMYHNFNRYIKRSFDITTEIVGQHEIGPNTNVWGLLVKGVRYFILSIGNQLSDNEVLPCDSRMITSYEECYISTLTQTFNDIKEYLTLAPYEIVILDVYRVRTRSNTYTVQPRLIVKLLFSILGEFIVPPKNLNYSSSLEEIWDTFRHLIVTFNDIELLNEFWWAWKPVYQTEGYVPPSHYYKSVLKKCSFDGRAYYTPSDLVNNITVTTIETLDGVKRKETKWFQNYWLTPEDSSKLQLYIGNAISDVPTVACLDELNNIVFQELYEGNE